MAISKHSRGPEISQRAGGSRTGHIKTRSRWLRVAFRLLLALVAAAILIPPVQVLSYRIRNPKWIPLMSIRKLQARSEGGATHEVRYRWQSLDRMPEYLVRCVVVSEDARYLAHDGIDWVEVEAAMKRSGRGASTISMQCARTLFLWQGRSWVRKGAEAYYTFWMERLLSKRRILELYLNVVETGKGIYGFPAAAEYYHGKKLASLSHRDLAYLAALLPAPTKWDPRDPSPKLRWRQALIVRREKSLEFPAAELIRGSRED